tara:strand:+ start:131 stop:730 length:600 start_codon:yes stop_codon:yes gene_type:complete
MPKVSQEKQVIKLLNNLQEKIEVFSDEGQETRTGVINEGAYLELSNMNMNLFRMVKGIEDENISLRGQLAYYKNMVDLIKKSDWFLKHTNDPDYQKRQVKNRQYKMDNPNYRLCECGDWMCKRKIYWTAHRKTEKCNSNRMRIRYERGKFKHLPPLDVLLTLDSHIHFKEDIGYLHKRVAINSLSLKYKQNKRRLGRYD